MTKRFPHDHGVLAGSAGVEESTSSLRRNSRAVPVVFNRPFPDVKLTKRYVHDHGTSDRRNGVGHLPELAQTAPDEEPVRNGRC